MNYIIEYDEFQLNESLSKVKQSVDKLVRKDKRETIKMPLDMIWYYREFNRESLPIDNTGEHLDNLEEQILKNGFTDPIRLRIDGIWAVVVEGNHRLAVAKRLKLKHVPVKVSHNEIWGPTKNRAKMIEEDLEEFLKDNSIKV